MTINATYEIRDRYLYIKVTGEFDQGRGRTILFEFIEKAHSHGLNRILCDVTLLQGVGHKQLPTMGKFMISQFVAETLPKSFMLAILETPQQLENDNFVENVMVNRGAFVKVTSNPDEALDWLGMAPTDKSREQEE